MKFNYNIIIESFILSFIMIFFSLIISYISDLFIKKKIEWKPKHFWSMIMGIFFTSFTVFILFANKYVEYKLRNT